MTKQDYEFLKQYCAQMMEHFDTVQIFVTRYNPEKNLTDFGRYAMGNQFANMAVVQDFVEFCDINDVSADEIKGTPDFPGDDNFLPPPTLF